MDLGYDRGGSMIYLKLKIPNGLYLKLKQSGDCKYLLVACHLKS